MAKVAAQRELEVVLVIRAKNPQATRERIASLLTLRGYELRVRPSKRIHDVYFDTPDGSLGRRKMNLRIREISGNHWITWKRGQGPLGFWRRNERRELELPWSNEAANSVLGELERTGIRLWPLENPELLSHVDALKSAGLMIVQDRETNREVRDVVLAGGDNVLAELSIDSVVYHFECCDVEFDELEVEAKAEGGAKLLGDVKDGLLELFGDLEEWRWGKLVTGRMIERMLKRGDLGSLLEGSRLGPEAFQRLKTALKP